VDKVITITGGTGSLGNQLVTTLLEELQIGEIRIVSRDEEKQLQMRRKFASSKIKFYIGDVRDIESLKRPFDGSDVVIHAAAMKQIDTCEYFPHETIKTNVLGAENVCRAAEGRTKRCVAISTDKATLPLNIYGMSKGLQERIFCGWSNGQTTYSAVRYGNVVGSRGSVIPYFKELRDKDLPLPITHPEMTRFWLRLKDAVELVLYASNTAEHGELLVPRMKASKIIDLAEVMSDQPWHITGPRPGEKLHEDIVSEDEARRAFSNGQYIHIQPVGVLVPPAIALTNSVASNTVEMLTKEELHKMLVEEGWL